MDRARDAPRSVPSKSSGSTPWMRWNSSLHCTVPVRRSHSQLPTFASASLSRTRASISARLACARRCSVMSRPISTDATGSRPPSNTGHSDNEIGTGMPSPRWTSVSRWRTASPAITVSTAACTSSADMGSEQLGAAATEDLLGGVPEEPLGGLVPAGDAASSRRGSGWRRPTSRGRPRGPLGWQEAGRPGAGARRSTTSRRHAPR